MRLPRRLRMCVYNYSLDEASEPELVTPHQCITKRKEVFKCLVFSHLVRPKTPKTIYTAVTLSTFQIVCMYTHYNKT